MKIAYAWMERFGASGLVLVITSGAAFAQAGDVLNGVGAVNQSMAGAGVAAPIDASGTLHWNPGALSRLGCCQVQFGMELFRPEITLKSSISSPSSMSGSVDSDSDFSAIPSMALTYRAPESRWSFGLGAFGISGFGVNYPASMSNPISMPQPNGFGSIFSRFSLLQLAPTFAYEIDDKWSVGFAPTINQASLAVDPAPFAAPNTNGTYPFADHADEAWGFGAQFGVLYQGASGWSFGGSYKSTQFFEDFEWNSADENGQPRELEFGLDFPSIISVGAAYTGIDKWTFAADLRYIDYANTDGFDKGGFQSDGSLAGFGWNSIWVVALGTQWQVSDKFALRGGYSWNSSPIDDDDTFFNVAAPAIIMNHLAAGVTYKVRDNYMLDASFTYGFENSISGSMKHPSMGNVPGTSVEAEMSTWSIVFGLRINF